MDLHGRSLENVDRLMAPLFSELPQAVVLISKISGGMLHNFCHGRSRGFRRKHSTIDRNELGFLKRGSKEGGEEMYYNAIRAALAAALIAISGAALPASAETMDIPVILPL